MLEPEEKAAPTEDSGEAKAKRKRIRKKKSKKGGDDSVGDTQPAKQTTASVVVTAMAAAMNPHSLLRNRLIEEGGYSARQVDRAMDEMWDKNLAYDDFEAILEYLNGNKNETPDKTTVETVTPNNVPGTGVGQPKHVEKRENETPSAPPPSGVAKSNLKQAPSMTMEQRLETVASFENMTDAIFALTEWVKKIATRRDLEDLCATKRTTALVLIFRRSIAEGGNQNYFDNSVLPSMAKLVESLLQKSGISSTAVTKTQNTFEHLLKQARGVYLIQGADSQAFAERVSRFIVSRISLAIGESSDAVVTPNGNSALAKKSSVASEDKSVADLLSKREINITAAKRYGVLARSACANLTSGIEASSVVENGGPRETEIQKSDIMLAILGEDGKATLERQMADLDELKSQAKEQESETTQELRTSIEELNDERATIQQRIVELKQSIENLETYDAELVVKIVEAQSDLDAEMARASVETNTLNDKINEKYDSIKYGDYIIGLVDLLKEYDDSLEKTITAPSNVSSVPDIDPAEFARRQMEVYLSRVRSYFQCEAETADFLRNRIATSTKAVDELKIEIIECEGLGMDTTIRQMKEAVTKKESLIETDATMIQRFTSEATSVFDTLLIRLGGYKVAQSASTELGAISPDSLNDLRASLSRLGVVSVDRLHPFLTPMNGSGASTTDVGILPVPGTSMLVSNGTAVPNTKMSVEKAPVMPKFSWAAAKTPSDPGTKTSILDIQKEELQSKGAK